MRNGITRTQITSAFATDDSLNKQEITSNSITDLEARIAELEMELRKQKAQAEKGAKLMQILWGDKFQSDSLH